MKHRVTFLAPLVFGVLVSLTAFESRVDAQNQVRGLVGDTGIVTLGPNQELRVTAAPPGDVDGADFLVFRRIVYSPNGCSGPVCTYAASSQTNSAPVQLMTGEAVAFQVGPDIHGNAVRVVALSNNRNMRGNASIVDRVTGAIITSWSWGVANSGSW